MSKDKSHPQSQCDHKLRYNYEFDAVYCPECKVWLDKNCGKPDCTYCAKRPDTPLGPGHDTTQDEDYSS